MRPERVPFRPQSSRGSVDVASMDTHIVRGHEMHVRPAYSEPIECGGI
jgi:hypothetical protein